MFKFYLIYEAIVGIYLPSVSYCLVIYYQNIKSYNVEIITALINPIGDEILLVGMKQIVLLYIKKKN